MNLWQKRFWIGSWMEMRFLFPKELKFVCVVECWANQPKIWHTPHHKCELLLMLNIQTGKKRRRKHIFFLSLTWPQNLTSIHIMFYSTKPIVRIQWWLSFTHELWLVKMIFPLQTSTLQTATHLKFAISKISFAVSHSSSVVNCQILQ